MASERWSPVPHHVADASRRALTGHGRQHSQAAAHHQVRFPQDMYGAPTLLCTVPTPSPSQDEGDVSYSLSLPMRE